MPSQLLLQLSQTTVSRFVGCASATVIYCHFVCYLSLPFEQLWNSEFKLKFTVTPIAATDCSWVHCFRLLNYVHIVRTGMPFAIQWRCDDVCVARWSLWIDRLRSMAKQCDKSHDTCLSNESMNKKKTVAAAEMQMQSSPVYVSQSRNLLE